MAGSARNHAIVLGGSIAGLLAARVLSEHYARVTLFERDKLPLVPAHRRGVPHDRHFHGLLPHGLRLIEDLFPCITDALTGDGALVGDVLAHIRWYMRGQMMRQTSAGLTVLSASRPLLEAAVRDRVRLLPNVRMRDQHQVTGLLTSQDRQRVTGIKVTSQASRSGLLIPADLVVDASGRGSRIRRWISELGYPPPPTDRVSIGLRYASRVFAASPAVFGNDIIVAVAPSARGRPSGVMQRIEGDRVLVTLVGVHGDRPPPDPDGFARYAGTLAAPDIYDLIRASTPLSGPAQFHLPTYERHRYEQMAAFPAGLLLVGDAVCSFNPVYSEGISAAARTALALHDQLAWDKEPGAAQFFRSVSAALDSPWELAASSDLAAAHDAGSRPSASPLSRKLTASLDAAAADDAYLATAYVRVLALVDPPSALLSPEIQERLG